MWELDYKESWAPKNWCFWLWCWRRLLRVPWTAKRSSQSILKEISPEYSLEGPTLMLKLHYSGHLMQRTDSLGKTLMLGKIEGRRRRGHRGWDSWMASPTWWTWVWLSSRGWWWTGKPSALQSMGLQRVGHDWATQLNWVIYFIVVLAAKLCPTLCISVACSTPGLPVHHRLPELAQTHVHWVMMPSNRLILCCPLLLPPSIFPRRVFPNESVLCIRWPKYWSFSFSISPSSEYSGISFRMDWLDLLAGQGTLKSLLQHHSAKGPILQHSAFFIV